MKKGKDAIRNDEERERIKIKRIKNDNDDDNDECITVRQVEQTEELQVRYPWR